MENRDGILIDRVNSIQGKNIRLTDERWAHITGEHSEMGGSREDVLKTVNRPEKIFLGGAGELLAVREVEEGKFLVVVYREGQTDGFIITAFQTRRIKSLERRQQVWP